jgi:hypothetical protein
VNRVSIVRAVVTRGLAVAFLLVACAGRGENPRAPGPPDPDSDVSTTLPSPSSPEPKQTPLLVTPRPGLVDVRPNPFEKVLVLDERTLEVRFWGGVDECYGVDRVDVNYGESEITVTVYLGRVPTAEVCIEIAVLTAVRVNLDEPISDRNIVDGAANL